MRLFGNKKRLCYIRGHKWKVIKTGFDFEKNVSFEEGVCKRCGETYSIIQPCFGKKAD